MNESCTSSHEPDMESPFCVLDGMVESRFRYSAQGILALVILRKRLRVAARCRNGNGFSLEATMTLRRIIRIWLIDGINALA